MRGHNSTSCPTSGPCISSLCTILQCVFTPLLTVNSDTHKQNIGTVRCRPPQCIRRQYMRTVITEDIRIAHLSFMCLLVVCKYITTPIAISHRCCSSSGTRCHGYIACYIHEACIEWWLSSCVPCSSLQTFRCYNCLLL